MTLRTRVHDMMTKKSSPAEVEKILRSEFHFADLHVKVSLDGLMKSCSRSGGSKDQPLLTDRLVLSHSSRQTGWLVAVPSRAGEARPMHSFSANTNAPSSH